MIDDPHVKKLDSYFGFARKKSALFVGLSLDRKLIEGRIDLLIFNKDCPDEVKEKLISSNTNKNLKTFTYLGDYNISLASGYEKTKAIGITDFNLAKAILQILQNDK